MTKLVLVLMLAGFGAGGVQLMDVESNELVRIEGWVEKCEVEVKKSTSSYDQSCSRLVSDASSCSIRNSSLRISSFCSD